MLNQVCLLPALKQQVNFLVEVDLLAFGFQRLAVHVLQERGDLLLVERGKLFLESGVVGTSLLGFAVHFLLDGVEGGVELAEKQV